MRIFCTVFDKNYLCQGLALYNSLNQVGGDFLLHALCLDEIAYSTIDGLKLNKLVPISLNDLDPDEVSAAKKHTTYAQFCWVCQPLICEYLLDKFGFEMVTYLEADSYFFSDPEVLFEEMGGKAASLSPHNYTRRYDKTATSGKFCTQFNAFRNNVDGRLVLADWKNICFQYDKNRPNFYPGQKLLDDWPEKFDCIGILGNKGAGVAPWNIQQYKYELVNGQPYVDGCPVIFYHFHGYGRYKDGSHELGYYVLPKKVIFSIYSAYIRELRSVDKLVKSVDPAFRYRREFANNKSIKDFFRSFALSDLDSVLTGIKRRLKGTYNIFRDEKFVSFAQ